MSIKQFAILGGLLAAASSCANSGSNGAVQDGTCAGPLLPMEEGDRWVVVGSNGGAASEYDGSCAENSSPEQIVAWVAPDSAYVEARLTAKDPILHVRTDCTNAATELACNDDENDDTLNSMVRFPAVRGETYYFVVDSFDEEETSDFELSITIGQTQLAPLPAGLWTTRGYGSVIETTDTEYRLYQYSDAYCLIDSEGPSSRRSIR